MAILGSQVAVLVLGFAVFVLSAWGMYSPGSLVKMVTLVMNQSYGMYVAVVVRLILGAALIVVAPVSQFPMIFQALGWIVIIAAVGLIVIGRERLRSVIAWFEGFSSLIIRVWLLFGLAFAGFLIYGVL